MADLIRRLREGGIVSPRIAVAEAKGAGLRLELACALLEKESYGGKNVYGHDPTIFRGAGRVTRANYAEYKRQRRASGNRAMQGVGPCQLTWWEFQDAADAQGGCWRPEINMRVGFRHLAALIKRYGESDGARRYNGSGAAAEEYSRDLLAKARRWESIIDGAVMPTARPQRDADSRQPAAPPRITAMAHEVQRREAETARAWRALVVRGQRLRARLHDERTSLEDKAGGDELSQLLAALARIEGKLGMLVEISVRKPAETTLPAADETVHPVPATEGVATAVVAPVERPLDEYRIPELVREVDALEARTRRLREELIGRYEKVDDELKRLLGPPAQTIDRARPARRVRPVRRDDGRNGAPARDEPPRDRPRRRPTSPERDPLGGKVVNTTLGERGVFVRRSKIALSRYLAKKGNAEHVPLRRTLRREAVTPRTGGVASPAWAKAVRAAQHIAGRPVTGELDGELTKLLLPYWPRDAAVKRIARSTPLVWRAIPGQLTPNFNVKEFACKDAARTPYIKGLMREQGLSKKEARARAKALAERLERVRKLGGGRPLLVTSAYRTKAYNASLSGSATNSAHTRGFAVDMPPPNGVSLDQHKQHVLQAFECGVGYYPKGRGYFVHGDFDKSLGGRRVW